MRRKLYDPRVDQESVMRPKRFRDSIGQALITVLAVITLLALLPAVVLEATNIAVPITLQAENQHAALAAAEAGAAAYFSHLSADPSYTRYNDVTCNAPSPADGFYLAGCPKKNGGSSSYSIAASDITNDWVTVPNSNTNTSVPEAYVYTVTDPDPSNPNSSLELIVTGRSGNLQVPQTVQYRTLKIDLTSQITNAIFSNYNTASPYTYSNSEDFTILQDGVKLALAAANDLTGGTVDGIDVSTVQNDINEYLGSGPVGNINLGQLFCGYHSYQLNPVADLVQEALAETPTLLNDALAPYLGNFDPLGLPIGQYLLDAISDVTNAVTSALSSALFSENFLGEQATSTTIDGHTFDWWTGPFPLVCNVSELYGSSSSSYYGLSTQVSGPVYSNDQFYTCTSGGSSTALNGDKVQIGASSLLSGSSSSIPQIPENPAPGGAFTLDNLPQITFTIPIINYTFDVSTGCSNSATPVTPVGSEPTPVPDFSAIKGNAACTFYGPTFIDFQGSTADIWSPDTPEMGGPGSGCSSGPSADEYVSSSNSQGTVLYVHNLPESEACQPFPSSFVLPFGRTTPIQHHSCYWGDALVQGAYSGDWTIGASNDIVITGSVIAQGGMESSMLGLAPGGNVPISEPYVGSSGVFYPQGNVVINHPVVNGENDNNCSFVTMPSGGSPEGLPSQCSPPIPQSIEAPPPAQQCSFSITLGYFECLLDVNLYEAAVHYMYNIVKAGYYCGMGSQAEALLDLGNCTQPTSSGLYLNAGVSNDNPNATGVPTFSGSPPSGCSSSSDWSTSFLPSGCVVQYFDYYWNFGSEAGTAFDEFCSLFSGDCNVGGYESQLATWEASWVHGPRNSFPAVYNPVIDADILASNSSSQVTGTSFGGSTPQNITNGSFTVQNVDSGNSGSYSRAGHGLGTLTENGAIVESYADGLANAGLTMNHFHIFDSGCEATADACYVASGYHNVDINYSPDVVLNPPPYLVKELQGVEWVSSVQELPVNKVLIGV
jgi:Tfp pilus assembly protein PilX